MGKRSNSYKNIPEYFGYLEKNNKKSTPLYPLSFIPDDGTGGNFIIAGKHINRTNFRPRKFAANIEGVEGKQILYPNMPNYPLLVSDRGAIVVGPLLHNFLASNLMQSIDRQTLCELGVDVAFTDRTGITVNEKISNASLSVNSASYFFLGDPIENGFAEYNINEAKSRESRVNLYAAAGYLGHIAAHNAQVRKL